MKATFLVHRDYIEVVPIRAAARETKSSSMQFPGWSNVPAGPIPEDVNQLSVPLVNASIKEQPLNQAVAQLAEEYDATVVVSTQTGDAKTAAVSARLLNVPLDKALELLALQADLRVVPRGKAFLITSAAHARTLLAEDDKGQERQQAELGLPQPAPLPRPSPKKEKE